MRHEPGDDEVQIMHEAKGLAFGVAILIGLVLVAGILWRFYCSTL